MFLVPLRSHQRPSLEVAGHFPCNLSLQPQPVRDVRAQSTFAVVSLSHVLVRALTYMAYQDFSIFNFLKWFTSHSSALWLFYFFFFSFSQRLSFISPRSQNVLTLMNDGSLQAVLWMLFLWCLKYS